MSGAGIVRRMPARGVAVLALAACAGDHPIAPHVAAAAPVIDSVAIAAGPWNVLSAVARVRVRHADRIVVRFRPAGDGLATEGAAPDAVVAGDSASAPVLGLLPARTYAMRVVALGPGGQATSDSVAFTTGALPGDLPRYRAAGVVPQPGFVVFSAGTYGVVVDDGGRVVWYRRLPGGAGLSFMVEPTGVYAAHPPPPARGAPAPWLLFDALGNQLGAIDCAGGLPSRPHDLLLEPDGGRWLLCDSTRTIDLAALGGSATARVTGTVVQHVAADGRVLFQWTPFDHFEITDLDAAERRGTDVNWTHGNALDLDDDGNLLVSFRSLNEITKIDVRTGRVLWRFGGRANRFAVSESSAPPFTHQHGLRMLHDGAFVLLDNLGDPSATRAERWVVDAGAGTARLARAYSSEPAVVTPIGGSVQALPRGHLLVSFGTAGRVVEYDSTGRVVWRIAGNAGYVFRAQRFRSLYAPGRDASR